MTTIVDNNIEEIDITKKGFRLRGKPSDISRFLHACKDAMRSVETTGRFQDEIIVLVQPPQEDE